MTANQRAEPHRQCGTVWAFPPPPPALVTPPTGVEHHTVELDADAGQWWHAPLLTRIKDEFATPGARILLLGWPPTDLAQPPESLDAADEPGAGSSSAGLVVLAAGAQELSTRLLGEVTEPCSSSRQTQHPDQHAARRLAPGGFLVVLTAPRYLGGALDDPSGPLIRRAQASGLLYLQHIVLVTVPLVTLPLGAVERNVESPRSPTAETHARVHRDLLILQRPSAAPATTDPVQEA